MDRSWSDDPERWYEAADKDGAFDVTTGWPAQPNVSGSFDKGSGGMVLVHNYADDHHLVQTEERGTLTVLAGGDYRWDGTWVETDVNDDETHFDVQAARFACHEDWQWTAAELTYGVTRDWFDGYYAEDIFQVQADGTIVRTAATSFADGHREFENEEVNGDTTGHTSGVTDWDEDHTVADFYGQSPDVDYEGHREIWRDGSEEIQIEWTSQNGDTVTLDATINYDGDGDGTMVLANGDECDVEYDDGERFCDCGSGNQPC